MAESLDRRVTGPLSLQHGRATGIILFVHFR